MPRPLDRNATYLPGLDGVRALAVVLVICAHLGLPWAGGGVLGVGIFFTLSGFLITSILVVSWEQRGNLRLRLFWIRRARRLLPAVIVLSVVVLAATAILDPGALGTRLRDAAAALFYLANWNTIGKAYVAANTQATNPLEHLWSLSVEEQFYLAWPLMLWGLLVLCRGRMRLTAAITSALAAGSFALSWWLFAPGIDGATRAYEGTDTRAGALLVGAVAALLWLPMVRSDPASRVRRATLDGAALVALGSIALLVWKTDQYSAFLYPWGFLLLSVATAVVLMAVVQRGSAVGALFGCAPLRWVGERSYGIYLWQTPVIVFSQGVTGRHGWQLDVANVTVTLALAAMSWTFVEDPIRKFGFRATFTRAPRQQPIPTHQVRLPTRPVIACRLPTPVSHSARLPELQKASKS